MADERKYFVLCANNCKFESMTKEQIIAAIAEATGKTPTDIDAAFITKIKEINKGAAIQLWQGTQAEFNAHVAKNGKKADVFYNITDYNQLDEMTLALWNEFTDIKQQLEGLQRKRYILPLNEGTNEITASEEELSALYNDILSGENIEIVIAGETYTHFAQYGGFTNDGDNVFLYFMHSRVSTIYTWRLSDGFIAFWNKRYIPDTANNGEE